MSEVFYPWILGSLSVEGGGAGCDAISNESRATRDLRVRIGTEGRDCNESRATGDLTLGFRKWMMAKELSGNGSETAEYAHAYAEYGLLFRERRGLSRLLAIPRELQRP